MDLQRVKQLLKQPVIIDGRNMFPLEYMRISGFTYHSVGRPAVHADRQIKELAR